MTPRALASTAPGEPVRGRNPDDQTARSMEALAIRRDTDRAWSVVPTLDRASQPPGGRRAGTTDPVAAAFFFAVAIILAAVAISSRDLVAAAVWLFWSSFVALAGRDRLQGAPW